MGVFSKPYKLLYKVPTITIFSNISSNELEPSFFPVLLQSEFIFQMADSRCQHCRKSKHHNVGRDAKEDECLLNLEGFLNLGLTSHIKNTAQPKVCENCMWPVVLQGCHDWLWLTSNVVLKSNFGYLTWKILVSEILMAPSGSSYRLSRDGGHWNLSGKVLQYDVVVSGVKQVLVIRKRGSLFNGSYLPRFHL